MKRISIVCQSVGVQVTVNVVALATADNWYTSVTSTSITAVASSVVVTTRFVIRLFVRVLVDVSDGITTHSTAMTPAETRAIVVSLAAPSSIVPVVVEPVVPPSDIVGELTVVVPPAAAPIFILVVELAAPPVPRLTALVVAAAVAFVE